MTSLIVKVNLPKEELAQIEKRFDVDEEIARAVEGVELSSDEEAVVRRLLLKSGGAVA